MELGMAEYLTDEIGITRSAKFERPESTGDSQTGQRVARFRPTEEVALRLDIVEAFRASRVEDATIAAGAEVVRDAHFDAALADESVGRFDHAIRRYREIAALELPQTSLHLSSMRRVFRGAEHREGELGSLEALSNLQDEASRLAKLDLIRCFWADGAEPSTLLHALASATSGIEDLKSLGVFEAWLATQTAVDALLASGRHADAFEGFVKLASHPAFAGPERARILERCAHWQLALGYRQESAETLAKIGDGISTEARDLAVFLAAAGGEASEAVRWLRGFDSEADLGASGWLAVGAALERGGEPALDAYHRAEEASPDDVFVLRRLASSLEIAPQGSDALTGVLNRRLEVESLDDASRAALLWRLGRIYETQAGLEEAAAEVYREALELKPDDAPTLRALGRLYARKGYWEGLVQLFEREIEALEDAPGVWRRHFQAAELLEEKIGDMAAALRHFKRVLALKPDYLPALKGAARILETTGQWAALADLCLESVARMPNVRQKLYLLSKVAEVAEFRLESVDVAIGAWEEILHLVPDHPTGFAALGRLYARSGRWQALIDLNVRELDLVDDPEEAAALLVRSAELAIRELGDEALGEELLLRALGEVPDDLPALEMLGRIYLHGHRWTELIEMTDQQLLATDDEREIVRQLGSLAEIVETRLGSEGEATRIYEGILRMRPGNAHAIEALQRLYRVQERWTDVLDLTKQQLGRTRDPLTRSHLHGELAFIYEWEFEAYADAYSHWMAGLEINPCHVHALEGVVRTWRSAQVDPGELIRELQNLAASPMEGGTRDRYFKHLARLREVVGEGPGSSSAWRQYGEPDDAENLAVNQLTLVIEGDRAGVHAHRKRHPFNAMESIAQVLDGDSPAGLKTQLSRLSPDEREYVRTMASSREVARSGWSLSCEYSLLSDLYAVLDNRELEVCEGANRLRLRALAAGPGTEQFREKTLQEISAMESPLLQISRLVELARVNREHDREGREQLERAVGLLDAVACDAPLVRERLYAELKATEAWELLRRALELHLQCVESDTEVKAAVLTRLAQVLEVPMALPGEALETYVALQELTKTRDAVEPIVRISRELGQLERALEWQRQHYEMTIHDEKFSLSQRGESALLLADLYEEFGEPAQAIEVLEVALHPVEASPEGRSLKQALAHLHASSGDARRAVTLFEEILPIHPTQKDLKDWRSLVELHYRHFADHASAYSLQWKLVRSLPSSSLEIERLLELAYDLGELPDCCEKLEDLAAEVEPADRVVVLGRAAEAYDEDLNRAEDAARLYTELVASTNGCDRLHWLRRLAFTKSRIAGAEREALARFSELVREEPFELSSYRGMADLLKRVQAHDRARVVREVLAVLDEREEVEDLRIKSSPSRSIAESPILAELYPEHFRDAADSLRSVGPLAERVWPEDMPQRKALEGARLKEGPLFEAVEAANELFGNRRFKVLVGDAGPMQPQVFSDGTMWFNVDLVHGASNAQLRFFAGYAAALLWSELAPLLHVDGRRIWHLLEGALYRQTSTGFSDRVDARSQEIASTVSSPLFAVARRKLVQRLEESATDWEQVHCEAWPRDIEAFAARAGLTLAGRVPDALEGVLRLEGWRHGLHEASTLRRVKGSSIVRDLIEFALSDAYLEARYSAGLAGKPSTVIP